ncbi:PepSY domain-containing protein [Xanthomonas hyacinthi]|uniref:PepSY domain-containing protein n=1 Tax=Xanthomonas hyacinthi TaxID=56455 RepID=A0A2S7EVC3_9XANT|nr:PepSY-associated TM helix domain-containing protein [Xanthomonas hyacinthi]KLD72763.1 membrane protein [Xanthomonas hyacinthi DSM 19077]PPU97106.1 PepSY domain-containing protein [Xanthomonas hyacinthi]QGY78726.1 PepSY domain-containing protein [Xanthomonas hyacinthi]
MKQGFRQSMAWLHTWTGLLVGWVLLLIFMAGTASYFRNEISRWMRPELPRAPLGTDTVAARAVALLERDAPQSPQWTVSLPGARSPFTQLFWRNPPPADGSPQSRKQMFGDALLDPLSGEASTARDTRGGDFFYRLHFDLHYIPVMWARYIVGFCAMFMLVAIISGVITHKKIFKDFFTFRPAKGQRSWLDFHNVSAVLALPYHAMITYTGLVTLMLMYLPWGIKLAYPDAEAAFYAEAFQQPENTREASGQPGRRLPIARLLDVARAEWGAQAPIAGFSLYNPGDAAAVIEIRQGEGQRLAYDPPSLLLDAGSGQVLARSGNPGAAAQTRSTLYGLHLAHFAGDGLRWLFFGSGLLGCLMVASGVILWAVKERPKHAKAGRIGFGLRLVDALNIGTVAGLPIAFAAYFWGNRLIPVHVAERPDQEAAAFFLAWAAALLAAFVWPRRVMWAWQLYLGAALFALLPVLNALTSEAHLGNSIPAGDWALAGVDLVCFGLGCALALAARRMQRWQPSLSAAERRARERAAAAQPVSDTGLEVQ